MFEPTVGNDVTYKAAAVTCVVLNKVKDTCLRRN